VNCLSPRALPLARWCQKQSLSPDYQR